MRHLEVKNQSTYSLGPGQLPIPPNLIKHLYQFLDSSYHLNNEKEMEHLIIQPEKEGELVILYGAKDEIAGLIRNYKVSIQSNHKKITAYYAYIYLHRLYKVIPTISHLGLTKVFQYKEKNPQEELIYLAFIQNPRTYDFIYHFTDIFYPKPNEAVPDGIINIIDEFKKQHGWRITDKHPMLVNSPLVPLRSQIQDDFDEHSELGEFYLKANPEFMQGNSLLIYIPLHWINYTPPAYSEESQVKQTNSVETHQVRGPYYPE